MDLECASDIAEKVIEVYLCNVKDTCDNLNKFGGFFIALAHLLFLIANILYYLEANSFPVNPLH